MASKGPENGSTSQNWRKAYFTGDEAKLEVASAVSTSSLSAKNLSTRLFLSGTTIGSKSPDKQSTKIQPTAKEAVRAKKEKKEEKPLQRKRNSTDLDACI